MRGALERLLSAFGGRDRRAEESESESESESPQPSESAAAPEQQPLDPAPRDELPSAASESGVLDGSEWISSQPRRPRALAPIIANIRDNPRASVGRLERPAALGTMLEGALAFALDDAIDERCTRIEVRLLRDGSASVEHAGPGFDPQRCVRGCQRWPWLRRSPEGEVMLTRTLSAPVVTCALSHWLRIEVSRDDGLWRAAFYRGHPESRLTREPARRGGLTYTRISFRPDPEVFAELSFSIDDLYLRGLGLLLDLPGVELSIYDERTAVPPLVIMGTGTPA